jgi:hypothetical protein
MPPSVFAEYGFRHYLPLILLFALMVAPKISPRYIYDPGLPFDFMVSALAGLFCGRRMNLWKAAREAMKDAIPVMGILVGVGMFIQIMTLTGARGWFVVESLGLPKGFLLIAVATAIRLQGSLGLQVGQRPGRAFLWRCWERITSGGSRPVPGQQLGDSPHGWPGSLRQVRDRQLLQGPEKCLIPAW